MTWIRSTWMFYLLVWTFFFSWDFPVAQTIKNLPAMQETRVQSLGQEKGNGNPLQHSSWRVPWTEDTGRLQSLGLQRVWHNWVTNTTSLLLDICSPYMSIRTSVQFNLVAQSCPTLFDPTDFSMPGLPVHHQLLKFTQTHVHKVSDTIQPSHPLSPPSPPTFNVSQHQGLFKVLAKVLELQLQHQFF